MPFWIASSNVTKCILLKLINSETSLENKTEKQSDWLNWCFCFLNWLTIKYTKFQLSNFKKRGIIDTLTKNQY